MGRPAASVRLKAAPALEHLFGKSIQVLKGRLEIDKSGHAVCSDKEAARLLLLQEHWSLAEDK